MRRIKVAAGVLNQTPRDWDGNMTNILNAIQEAKDTKVSVLCLPEMCITGYGLEDDFFCQDVVRRAYEYLEVIVKHCTGIVVTVGLPVIHRNALYNGIAVIVDGELAGIVCKQHLAGDGIHYEPRHFKPWPKGYSDKDAPVGDLIFNIGGYRLGLEICEDAWVANRPGIGLAQKGVHLILNPSASHFSFGKLDVRKNFVVEGSRAFNAAYIYTNLVGNEAGRAIYDGSALIASGGKLVAQGERFTFKNVKLTTAVIDSDDNVTNQIRTASYTPDLRSENGPREIMIDFTIPETNETNDPIKVPNWEKENTKHEECLRAVGLGLMDYMRKSHTNGYVVSLSGGSDSALVAYLCRMGIELGIYELGLDPFIKKYCPHLKDDADSVPLGVVINYLSQRLISTAYQATSNSGAITKEAASKLAFGLALNHREIDVDKIVKLYQEIGCEFAGRELNFKDDSIPLQNIQARVRSPSIWMLANLENKLLLTTSNMSEAALGYATMDGDTSGCVAPIAGLPKNYIREFLCWVEKSGPAHFGPCVDMKYVNDQQPTAELMPEEYNQTDESDLMPYWLLHKIETMVVNNRYSPLEIYKALVVDPDLVYHNYTTDRLANDIKKFFVLFSRNQWKRERYALSFHLDDHNLDPRSWCRAPILTGGYKQEIEEMMAYANCN